MATRKEIGEHLDLSVQNVGRLVSDGVLYAERGVGGDLDECRIAYIRHLRKRATGQKRTSESLDEARTRKTSADASISEAKEELLRGSLVPVDDVKRVVKQLRQHGRVLRPYLGLQFVQLDAVVSAELNRRAEREGAPRDRRCRAGS